MKKIGLLIILILLVNFTSAQNNRIKIYDSPYYGIMNFYSLNINGSSQKVLYLMHGFNYINPNESGKVFRLDKNTANWVVPHNGFFNPYWCFGAIPPNPPQFHCNEVSQFCVSPVDTQFIIKNSEVYCGSYEAGNQFYITYNGGFNSVYVDSFSQDMFAQICTGFDINPVNDSILYVVYPVFGVYSNKPDKVRKSTNRGVNWFITDSMNVFESGSQFTFVKINPQYPNYIYVSGSDVFMSTNSGYGFFELNVPKLKSIYFDLPGTNVYGLGSWDSTLYKSTDNGFNWTQLYKFNERPNALEISPDNHNILYLGMQSGLYRSTNAGVNWSLYYNTFNPSYNVIGASKDPGTGDTLYVSTSDAVYKVWGADTTVYYTVSGRVFFSDNNQPVTAGKVKALKYDWVLDQITAVDSALIDSSGYFYLPKCPEDSLDIMAYSDDELMDFVPTYYDSTIHWQNSITLFPTGNINNVNIKVHRIIQTEKTADNFVSGGVYKAMLIPNDALKDAVVYAVCNNQFAAYGLSISNGYYIIDSLPAGKCDIIVDRMGYNSDYRSLLVGDIVLDTINFFLTRVVGSSKQISSLTTSFMLFQNYPNPFNPLTTLNFNIPPMHNIPPAHPGGKGVFVKLIIYDVLGREVVTLVNDVLDAGSYKVVWDASNYSSGMYFYKLIVFDGASPQANPFGIAFTETKKMVLIK